MCNSHAQQVQLIAHTTPETDIGLKQKIPPVPDPFKPREPSALVPRMPANRLGRPDPSKTKVRVP